MPLDPKQVVSDAVGAGLITMPAPPEPPTPKTPRPITLSEAKRIERKYWLRGGVTKKGKPLYLISPK